MKGHTSLLMATTPKSELHNFRRSYKRLLNFWQIFDNSVNPPRLLDEGSNP
jgi:hypothetical protein